MRVLTALSCAFRVVLLSAWMTLSAGEQLQAGEQVVPHFGKIQKAHHNSARMDRANRRVVAHCNL